MAKESSVAGHAVRIAYLYTYDISHEMQNFKRGLVPSHRLFGFHELSEHGALVRHFAWPRVVPQRGRKSAVWKILQALWFLMHQRHFDVAVCTTEAASPPLLALRAIGLLRLPIVVINVALLKPNNENGFEGACCRFFCVARP